MMAKRKRLAPARLTDAAPEVKSATPRASLANRPPIADVAHDAAASAALTEVATELTAARTEERLIQRIPLRQIDLDHLVRDRALIDEEELEVLAHSLAARGQQTAIEVSPLENGRYGLISGYRRLLALHKNGTDTVLAIVRAPGEAADAYQAMVEENEIRAPLSFYERGRIVARAVDAGVYRADRLALAALFAAVPRARRSKIGSCVIVVRALDDVLKFPTQISEKQGLTLAKRLVDEPGLKDHLRQALKAKPPQSAADEAAILNTSPVAQAPAPKAKTPAAKPAAQATLAPLELRPGLELVRHADGGLTFQGDKMRDRAFVARLMEAVKAL